MSSKQSYRAANNRHGIRLRQVNSSSPPESRMSLSSKTILDKNGNPFLPMGFNYGHNAFYDAADCLEDKNLGCNSVRIIPRGWGDYPNPGQTPDGEQVGQPGNWNPDYIANIIGPQILAAKANGLAVDLARDSNCGFNCHTGQPECTINGVPNQHYWNNTTKKNEMLAAWDFLVDNFVGYIDFYEPGVEYANSDNTVTVTQINDLQEEIMDRILIKDPDALFIIGGRSYANNNVGGIYRASWATKYPNKIILTCNFLGGALSTDFLAKRQNLVDARDANNVPIICQQLGIALSEDPDDSLTQAGFAGCLEENIGVLFWEKVTAANSFGIYARSGAGVRTIQQPRYNTVTTAIANAT